MIPQIPIPEPTNLTNVADVQSSHGQQWNLSNNQAVKEIFLRHLINGSIKENSKHAIKTGVTIVDLQKNRTLVGHDQDTTHFAASINKLPVALLVLNDLRSGALRMDQTLTWSESDRRAGNGTLDQSGSPTQATLKDVLYDMLHNSGNTAVRVLVNNALGGAHAVNERFAAQPDLANTRLQPLDGNRFYLGDSSTHDSMWTIVQLTEKQDPPAAFMKEAMATNIFEDFGVRSQLSGDFVVLVNKVGILDDVEGNNRHDVGIVYNKKTHKSYGYAFFTTAPYSATDPSATMRADQSLKDMGRTTLRYAGDSKPKDKNVLKWRSQTPEQRVHY